MILLKYSGEFSFLIYLIVQGINNNITIGEITLYSGLSLSMIESFNRITSSTGEFFEYELNHIQRYNEFENQIPQSRDLSKNALLILSQYLLKMFFLSIQLRILKC